jgi:hypothetical protein
MNLEAAGDVAGPETSGQVRVKYLLAGQGRKVAELAILQ